MKPFMLMALAMTYASVAGAAPIFKCFAPNVNYDGWQEIRFEPEGKQVKVIHQVFGDIQKDKNDRWFFVKPRLPTELTNKVTCTPSKKEKLVFNCSGEGGTVTTTAITEKYLYNLDFQGLVDGEDQKLRVTLQKGLDEERNYVFPQVNCTTGKYPREK